MGDFRVCFGRPDGVVMEDRPLPLAMGPVSNPDPSSISEDRWAIAEETSGEVINCIHPTLDSEEKRKDVIDYIQRLIRNSICCEVFPYGSVPLKTYLPDGDIDLTALASPSFEEYLAHNVLAILQWEEHNENAEYEVKDTQFIDAEVKLVKCLVQNIVIDISFNQLGGLSTLCFLEQVDRLVCKDHLFKRSIILIKAWCYYESRILGAHHGLISTYALEILVLYIFHLFHSTLNGPLAVLYRFLDYFSKFDWENYCISLNGPVRRSSLPDVLVEIPENTRDGLMLSEEFLRNCVEMFSVPSKDLETNSRAFPQKHLNIIDPLKESNNLGRSVHRGNFYRIRSAFKHGAHKLGRILQVPGEKLPDEIKKFFGNTLDRHGYSYGLNIRNLSIHSEALSENEMHMKLSNENFDYDFLGIQQNYNISSSRDEIDRYLSRVDDPNELVTPRSSSSSNFCTTENGFFENREVFHKKRSLVCSECSCGSNHGGLSSCGSEILSLNGHGDLENLCRGFKSLDFREMADDAENLSDLSGDYDSHLRSLLYGQSFLGFALSGHTSPSQMMNTNGQSIHSYGNATTPINAVFGSEGKPKPRGTGAYFPKVNSCSWEEKPSQWKGRNRPPVNNLLRESGTNSFGQGNCKHHHQARSYRGLENGLSHQSKGVRQPNGFAIASCKIEFGSLGKLPNWSSKELSPTVSQTQERSGGTTYNLKNEDFPPLSL